MRDRQERGGGFLRGLVLGAIAGAGLFYFFNHTEEGKKAKKKLKKQSQDALENLTEIISGLEEKGEEFKKKAKELRVELEGKAKSVGGEVAKEVQEGLSQIEALREKGKRISRHFTRHGKPLKKKTAATTE